MKEKKETSPGCGILFILALLCFTWFLPDFIMSGGDAGAGFNNIAINIIGLLVLGAVVIIVLVLTGSFKN